MAARSVMTTHLIDRIAKEYGCMVKETPVGFKYIGDILVKEKEAFLIGGEESGGLTIRGHVPEKDGILACLLVIEMAADRKMPLKKILAEIFRRVGPVYSERINFRIPQEKMESLRARLETEGKGALRGVAVKDVVTIDGFKYLLEDGSWIGVRLSGTEPVARLYLEASSKAKLKELKKTGESLING